MVITCWYKINAPFILFFFSLSVFVDVGNAVLRWLHWAAYYGEFMEVPLFILHFISVLMVHWSGHYMVLQNERSIHMMLFSPVLVTVPSASRPQRCQRGAHCVVIMSHAHTNTIFSASYRDYYKDKSTTFTIFA